MLWALSSQHLSFSYHHGIWYAVPAVIKTGLCTYPFHGQEELVQWSAFLRMQLLRAPCQVVIGVQPGQRSQSGPMSAISIQVQVQMLQEDILTRLGQNSMWHHASLARCHAGKPKLLSDRSPYLLVSHRVS